jgi:predicted TPR repeat methyltransferase
MTVKLRDFDKDAAQWDENPGRVAMAGEIARAMLRETAPGAGTRALDFGCGTGLVTLALAPLVGAIVGADTSAGMLGVLEAKVHGAGLTKVTTCLLPGDGTIPCTGPFDLIVSSMALHHVPELDRTLLALRELLAPGGTLAIADLDAEDGNFHADNTGVFHFGFDRGALAARLRGLGFGSARAVTATRIPRPQGDGSVKEYPVFLAVAGR